MQSDDLPLDCQEAIHTLYHYLDGELTEYRRVEIRQHLDDCMPCLEAFDFEAELRIVIAHKCRDAVPDHLRIRVAKAIRAVEESDDFFGPYTEKLWGIPPSQISADWASQRISLLSLSDVIVRLLGLRRGGARTYARRYLYPRLGIGQIFERMAAVAERHGARFRLATRVTGLERARDGNVHAVRFCSAAHGDEELRCDAVISTVALPLLARMLGGASLPSDVARAAGRLRFRAIRLVHLLLDRAEFSPHTWLYVSEPQYRIARIQEPRRRSPDMAPPGRTSLMLELPCDVGDELWNAGDDEVTARCLDELRALGFGDVGRDVAGHFSSFVAEGYPIYHLDYRRERERVLGYCGETPNVVSVGRQGAFRYVFMDTAMEMGVAAAEQLLGRAGVTRPSELGGESGLIEARALTA